MTDDPMADDVYQPTGGNEEQQDAAPLDLEDALDERDYDDILDEGYSPPERPLGLDKVGVTAAEQRAGESLDERLAEEVPDDTVYPGDGIGDLAGGDGEPVDPQAGAGRAGRLVAPGTGTDEDPDSDLFAEDVGIDGGAAGAEEAAVHIVPEDDPWE
ncbi:DUF5709 domain-containing protein [Streptomyces sp. NPDC088354]|uniref:DUF5709 domain-containing protein n=1 Tax=unclassified Streptomyces TaxID=2593676 RepID=UPI0029A7FBEF|nr:DUF5709 domain-containing protein [Streptomyces sp. MI02-7b]MDX3076832.1 DUF5709 domain-containing protein [Streptomyces sp. MI02-7b]